MGSAGSNGLQALIGSDFELGEVDRSVSGRSGQTGQNDHLVNYLCARSPNFRLAFAYDLILALLVRTLARQPA